MGPRFPPLDALGIAAYCLLVALALVYLTIFIMTRLQSRQVLPTEQPELSSAPEAIPTARPQPLQDGPESLYRGYSPPKKWP